MTVESAPEKRVYQSDPTLAVLGSGFNASAAKNTLKMSVWFAGYFGLFQVLKYGAMVARCAEAPAAAAGCWLLLSRPLC